MLIANAKRKSNIIEYILYMYQIEDIIRSFQFDIGVIENTVIKEYQQGDIIQKEIKDWYLSLIGEMKQEQIEKKGHLMRLKEIINELQHLHLKLLTTVQDKKYIGLYESARPILKELLLKSVGEQLNNEMEIALHGLYGLLLLKLKEKEIAEETQLGMQKVSALLAYLAYSYQQEEAGSLLIRNEQKN